MLSSEDAGHRDWQDVRKNNLKNMAKEPKKTPQPPLDPGRESLREYIVTDYNHIVLVNKGVQNTDR